MILKIRNDIQYLLTKTLFVLKAAWGSTLIILGSHNIHWKNP